MYQFISVLLSCQWPVVDMKKQHIWCINQVDLKNDRLHLYRRMPLSPPPPPNVEPIQPTHLVRSLL